MEYRISRHAEEELLLRGIPTDLIQAVLDRPGQVLPGSAGKVVLQSRVEHAGRVFLLRVIVAADVEPNLVVTAYLTSKIAKYWSVE